MNGRRVSLFGALAASVALAIGGCGSEEDPVPSDEVVQEAVADATEQGFTVTTSYAYSDSENDRYDDEGKGYVHLQVVFGPGGCIGALEYHEDSTEIILAVERAVLGTVDETQTLVISNPTADMLAKNTALQDCFVVP